MQFPHKNSKPQETFQPRDTRQVVSNNLNVGFLHLNLTRYSNSDKYDCRSITCH